MEKVTGGGATPPPFRVLNTAQGKFIVNAANKLVTPDEAVAMLNESRRSAVTKPEGDLPANWTTITKVVAGPDGKCVAAPCAISGCQYESRRSTVATGRTLSGNLLEIEDFREAVLTGNISGAAQLAGIEADKLRVLSATTGIEYEPVGVVNTEGGVMWERHPGDLPSGVWVYVQKGRKT